MNLKSIRLAVLRLQAATFRDVIAPIVLLVVVLCNGCGFGGGAPQLDEAAARSSLTRALEAWKQGSAPESLRQASPPILVGDTQWSAGAKLINYEVREPVSNDGSNLYAVVELELEDGVGQRSKQLVKYIVGTSPKITVFSQEPDGTL